MEPLELADALGHWKNHGFFGSCREDRYDSVGREGDLPARQLLAIDPEEDGDDGNYEDYREGDAGNLLPPVAKQ